MKLIKPSVEYIPQPEGVNSNNIIQHIDKCARTCYKSEDKFDENKSYNFVQKLIKSKHLAMLEHGTVYLYLEVTPFNAFSHFEYPSAKFTTPYNWSDVVGSIAAKYRSNPYSEVISSNDSRNYRKVHITTNFRVLVENKWLDDLQFICASPTGYHKKRYTMKFICDRGVSHELVRHRRMSFAQESQRYCNYSKDKFDNGITFIKPSWCDKEAMSVIGDIAAIDTEKSSAEFVLWLTYLANAEKAYLKLLEMGWTPQQARSVLPNATKTELIMTGFKEDWDHFFSLRYYGTTGKPHPDMQYIAKLAFDELESKSDYRYSRDEFYEGVTGTSFNKD